MRVLIRCAFILASAAAGALLASPAMPVWAGALAGALTAGLAVLAETLLRRIPVAGVAGLGAGAAAGLLLALLASAAVLPWLSGTAAAALPAVLLALAGAWLGATTGLRRADADAADAPVPRNARSYIKIMDTSVIIDGRLADVIEAGFIEGVIVVPLFVLRELQHVADSSDGLKRNRGRKGLDTLKQIQESDRVAVELTDRDFPDVREVDGKLLCLAEELGARILTNDYNLNKVAQLRGVQVLNVNDLANAMKPVVLPGEPLVLQVIKEGKERNQGVGYLDDGTMVVVDNGRRLIGQKVETVVSSVIQTNAGKMIFCALPDDEEAAARTRHIRRAAEVAVANGPTLGDS